MSLLLTYFTPCSSLSILNFEHVNADLEVVVLEEVARRYSGKKVFLKISQNS